MTNAQTDAATAAPRLHLTADALRDVGAPRAVIERFTELYPDGTDVTDAVCLAFADVVDFDGAALALLDEAGRRVYDEAVASTNEAFDAARDAAYRAFQEAVADVRTGHRRAQAHAFARAADVTAAASASGSTADGADDAATES